MSKLYRCLASFQLNRSGKRILTIIFFQLLCLVDIKSFAQTIIPRVGLTFSKSSLSADDMPYHDMQIDFKQGFIVGVAYQYPLTARTSLQVELSYVQKGQKVELKAESSELIYLDHRNFLIEYMELPISAKVSIARKPKIDFYLTGGINLSYWIGGKVDVDVYADMLDTNPYQYSETWPIKFESSASGPAGDTFYITNRFDIGIHVGFGTFLFNRFFIDARYVIGLSEIEFFKGANAGNRVVQFSIGLPIKLKVSKQ